MCRVHDGVGRLISATAMHCTISRYSSTRASWAFRHDTTTASANGRELKKGDDKLRRRIAQLQQMFSSDLVPPAVAVSWPKAVLKRWYEDGGTITMESAEMLSDEITDATQYIGLGAPVYNLNPTVQPAGGLLGAAARGESSVFEEIGRQLSADHFALADLGAPEHDRFWSAVCAEGRQLWPHMGAGILENREGTTTRGKDPSGSARGDRFITSCAAQSCCDCNALAALDAALACVGTALNHSALEGTLVMRTDPFFACFPGGGALYGSHFDGGGMAHATKLTTICYTNTRWDAERDGGALHLYDDARRCWRAVHPHAGRVVLFRADVVLHKVLPCHAERFALTAWWMISPRGERLPPGKMMMVDSTREVGDTRRRQVFERAHDGSTERGVIKRMRAACE